MVVKEKRGRKRYILFSHSGNIPRIDVDKFIKDEEYAKQRNLGIWSMKFKYPWEFRK